MLPGKSSLLSLSVTNELTFRASEIFLRYRFTSHGFLSSHFWQSEQLLFHFLLEMYKRRGNLEIVRFRYLKNLSSIFIRPMVVIFSGGKIFIKFLLELYQCPPIFFTGNIKESAVTRGSLFRF